jgi:hypothetical protein
VATDVIAANRRRCSSPPYDQRSQCGRDYDAGCRRVVADIKVREPDTFNTAFITALDPGETGFARGYISGIVQEEDEA